MGANLTHVELDKLKTLGIELSKKQEELLDKYARIFLEKNSRLNLISKNDEKLLFEKHIYDSFAINLFIKPKKGQSLLDIGTGGGFPSIPLSLLYGELDVYALDSIKKKIRALEEIKQELDIKNLYPVCERAENFKKPGGFDYVTSRAVAPIKVILQYAAPHIKKEGYFIAYKSKKALDELEEAKSVIKRTGLKMVDIVEYELPLEEAHQRNLVVFQKGI